jgi:hypothetical protein
MDTDAGRRKVEVTPPVSRLYGELPVRSSEPDQPVGARIAPTLITPDHRQRERSSS